MAARIPATAQAVKAPARKRGTPVRAKPSPVKAQADEDVLDDSSPEDVDELPGPSVASEAEIEEGLNEKPSKGDGLDDEDDDMSDLDLLDGEVGEVEDEPAEVAGDAMPTVEESMEAVAGDVVETPAPAKKTRGKAKPPATAEPFQSPVKTAKAGTVTVTRHFPSGETSEEEHLDVKTFVTFPASVAVNYGMTLNLGNYQSAKISVQVTLPCYVEELESAYSVASAFAEAKLQTEVDAIRGTTPGAAVEPTGDDVEATGLEGDVDAEAGDLEPTAPEDEGVEDDGAEFEEVD